MLVRSRSSRSGLVAAVAAFLLLTTACAADTDAGSDGADVQDPADSAPAPAPDAEGDGDYAFGSDRDQIAFAIEKAFSTKNATAAWEGETLVLSLDGDADEMMAGFTECRVLADLLTDDDLSAVVFPNGRVECADVLAP